MISDLRFSGLASGMDTESIVKKLMQAEKMPLNKILQTKQWQEWQRDAYRDVNKTLLDFRSSMEKLRLQNTFLQSKVSSTDSTKVGVSREGVPSLDSYEISVQELAKPGKAASVKFTINPRLSNANELMKENFDFEINGKVIKVSDKDSVKDVINKINFLASETGVRATYFNGDNSITLTTTMLGKNSDIIVSGTTANNVLNISNGTISHSGVPATSAKLTGDPLVSPAIQFLDDQLLAGEEYLKITIDGESRDINISSTIGNQNYGSSESEYARLATDLQNAINSEFGPDSVIVTNNGGRLEITSKSEGSSSEIIIGVTEFTARLGLAEKSAKGQDAASNFTGNVTKGEDASPGSVTINGIQHDITSNTFTYDGIKFSLNPSSVGETITINKETDTEAIFNDIKSFVDKYNEVIKSLNDKLSEKKFRDFKPLLTEQKESMKEKEIELWEEKAKSGLLNNDSIISSMLTKMRSSLYTNVSEDLRFSTLSDIGITTSKDYIDKGKLVLDEDKLKEAIANNLEDVKTLFTKTTEKTSEPDKHNDRGLAWRVYDQLNATMKEVTAKAGSSDKVDNSILGKSIGSINDRIDAFERRLAQVENRYWKQFTAMEKAIQKANSQSSWLMQQMGGMGM